MKNIKLIGITLLLVAAFGTDAACQQIKSKEQSLSLNFLQVKEGLNYGLVFRGPGLQYGRYWQWENESQIIGYQADGGLCFTESRGIIGFNLHLMPVRASYLRKIGTAKKLSLGLSITGEYNWQMYPDLQSGYSFWFTHFSLGGMASYPFEAGENRFVLKLHTSLLGITSRPPEERDEYFFDLSFWDVVRFLHQDFQFGSWNSFNQTGLEIKWQPKPSSRLAFAYGLNYYGYYEKPRITLFDQSVGIIFLPK